MYYYQTVSEAVNELNKRGYNLNFNLNSVQISCSDADVHLRSDEFTIDEVYRFEGDTDPGDEMVVYAISSAERNIKGVLVNAFGLYSDDVSSELIAKLSTHQ